ncbi:MAG TPA: hypothetical protein VF175_08020, partial [Lacipirellula sp.]
MEIANLPTLLAIAWLTPLASFVVILLLGKRLGHHGKFAGYISVGAILTSAVLSFVAMFGMWLPEHPLSDASHHGEHHEEGGEQDGEHEKTDDHTAGVAGRAPLLARAAVSRGDSVSNPVQVSEKDAESPLRTAGRASS